MEYSISLEDQGRLCIGEIPLYRVVRNMKSYSLYFIVGKKVNIVVLANLQNDHTSEVPSNSRAFVERRFKIEVFDM